MGNHSSKGSRKKESAVSQNSAKQKDTLQKVSQLERECIQSFGENVDTIDTQSIQQFKRFLNMTDNAKNQLERNGKPLTKPDFIAILLCLQGFHVSDMDSYQKMTTEELILQIRTIIYDPERFTVLRASTQVPPSGTIRSVENAIVISSPEKKPKMKQLTNGTPKEEDQLTVFVPISEKKQITNGTSKEERQLTVYASR